MNDKPFKNLRPPVKPVEPTPPTLTLDEHDCLEILPDCGVCTVEELKERLDLALARANVRDAKVALEHDAYMDGCSGARLIISLVRQVPNPHYEVLLRRYEVNKLKYDVAMTKYEVAMREYEEYLKDKDQREIERLKNRLAELQAKHA